MNARNTHRSKEKTNNKRAKVKFNTKFNRTFNNDSHWTHKQTLFHKYSPYHSLLSFRVCFPNSMFGYPIFCATSTLCVCIRFPFRFSVYPHFRSHSFPHSPLSCFVHFFFSTSLVHLFHKYSHCLVLYCLRAVCVSWHFCWLLSALRNLWHQSIL